MAAGKFQKWTMAKELLIAPSRKPIPPNFNFMVGVPLSGRPFRYIFFGHSPACSSLDYWSLQDLANLAQQGHRKPKKDAAARANAKINTNYKALGF